MEGIVEKLFSKIGAKYVLTVAVGRRAKEINAGGKVLIEDVSGKPDVIAMKEILLNKVRVIFTPASAAVEAPKA